MCPLSTARHISLGGEGNALYPVLPSCCCNWSAAFSSSVTFSSHSEECCCSCRWHVSLRQRLICAFRLHRKQCSKRSAVTGLEDQRKIFGLRRFWHLHNNSLTVNLHPGVSSYELLLSISAVAVPVRFRGCDIFRSQLQQIWHLTISGKSGSGEIFGPERRVPKSHSSCSYCCCGCCCCYQFSKNP